LKSQRKISEMPVLKLREVNSALVKPGVTRRFVHAKNLMLVVIDFDNGPWSQAEPMHFHVHEQATYVAEGEFIFFCEDEPDQKLSAGDMFWVASNKKHSIKLVDSFSPVREDFLV
jgi:quercetin dioxygenase-like cupin family protein